MLVRRGWHHCLRRRLKISISPATAQLPLINHKCVVLVYTVVRKYKYVVYHRYFSSPYLCRWKVTVNIVHLMSDSWVYLFHQKICIVTNVLFTVSDVYIIVIVFDFLFLSWIQYLLTSLHNFFSLWVITTRGPNC